MSLAVGAYSTRMGDVELIRQANTAWARRQWGLVFETFHRDVEFRDDRALQGETTGISGIQRYAESFMGTWTDYEIEYGDPVDAGGGVYYVPWEERGTGRGSGVNVNQDGATVYWVRDGKIARIHSFHDRGRARAEAGLPPE